MITEISLKDLPKEDKFPFNIKNIRSLGKVPLKIKSNIIFFAGKNGSGKTTLIEAIAGAIGINRYGGSINFTKKEKSILEDYLVIKKSIKERDSFFFRAETFFNLQKEMEEYEDPMKAPLYTQYTGSKKTFREMSHGQGFKAFFENRIRKGGLYFFDEPETALDLDNQLELFYLLKEFQSMDCNIFISTHSPILLAYPDCQIFSFEDDEIKEINYTESEPYKATKNFLDNYEVYRKEVNKLS